MTLFRLDYYQDDCGELIGFFTSKEAALEYAMHDRPVHSPFGREWTEIWEFKYVARIDLDERLDGLICEEQGRKAWEKGRIIEGTYYQ